MTIFKSLYFWIIIAFIAGILLGLMNPQTAVLMEPLGLGFIKLIKIFIGPIIFLTVTVGIAQTGSLKKLGKIGIKAIIYFEVVSTLALLIGWVTAVIFQPGAMMHAQLNSLDIKSLAHFLTGAEKPSVTHFLQNIIPNNLFEPFVKNDLLQILFIAILFGVALLATGTRAKKLLELLDYLTQSLFQIIRIIMYATPIGVFGAMAFTVGKFSANFLLPLMKLVGCFYLVGFLFVSVILGTIAKLAGFSLIRFLKYLLPELLLVLGTASGEAALPQLLRKLEKLGCEPETVGVVLPMGYSFNLDGTNIYITLAALFIAQALGIHLSFGEQLALFATAMVASKGAAGVTGAGFITLAATLSIVPGIPVAGIILVLGVDRFMSEARALINYIGNAVATLVISRWEKEITPKQLNLALSKNEGEV